VLFGGLIVDLGFQEASQGPQTAGRSPLARQALWSFSSKGWQGFDGAQAPQSSSPGNCLRPATDTEFAVDIAGVGLDRVQREEQPGRDLAIGQSLSDELKHFELAFA
jgi:hypothetical protein